MVPKSFTARGPTDRVARSSNQSVLGPWRLERLLGEGAWTQAFLASPLDSTPNATSDYVVKRIKPEFAHDARAVAMLQREAFLSKCVCHPHLACVLSAHVDRPPWFLVQPYQAGATVKDLLSTSERLAAPQALWIARQVSEALAALYQQQWLHGDVKPENVFVASNGHVTLGDLGFARRLAEIQGQRDIVLGTPAYLAPETLSESIPVTASSDTYSLGIMLYEMLTGRRPFPYQDEAELVAAHRLLTPPDPRVVVPQLPSSVCRVLRQMLAKEPLRRPVGTELVSLLVDLEIDAFDFRV